MIPIIVGLAISFPFIISEISPGGHTSNPPDLQLIDTLVEFGCSELAIYHLMDVSSILDKEFSGGYDMNLIGLPDGLLKEDFDKCVDIAISIRESNYTTTELEPDDLPQFALDCAVTHKFSQETQNCEIWWNSIYVVQSIIVVFFIIIISVIVIVYFWRKRK